MISATIVCNNEFSEILLKFGEHDQQIHPQSPMRDNKGYFSSLLAVLFQLYKVVSLSVNCRLFVCKCQSFVKSILSHCPVLSGYYLLLLFALQVLIFFFFVGFSSKTIWLTTAIPSMIIPEPSPDVKVVSSRSARFVIRWMSWDLSLQLWGCPFVVNRDLDKLKIHIHKCRTPISGCFLMA